MKRSTFRLLGSVALPALLAACSGGVGDGVNAPPTGGVPAPAPAPPPPPPPPPPTGLQFQFGTCFTNFFGMSTEVEATEPPAACVPPLDFNSEAIAG